MYYVNVKQIISSDNNINLYRGCDHGCIYCDSRSKCYHIDGKFEDIEVKANAISLLEEALAKRRKPTMIGTGSMCDPYLTIEKDLKLTRQMLEVVHKYHNGIYLLTKSTLVLRDLDLLKAINKDAKAIVAMTITTFDDNLCRIIEPNVALSSERFEAIKKLHDEGIEVGIWLTPILPFINDDLDNIVNITKKAIECGASFIVNFHGFGLTLREGNREYFYQAIDRVWPNLSKKYDQYYHKSYEIASPNNKILYPAFIKICEENNIMYDFKEIFSYIKNSI